MMIKLELMDNPYVTSQEKGVSYQNGRIHFYEKKEVIAMRNEYTTCIKRYMRVNGIEPPKFKGSVKLKVVFCYKTTERKKWGHLKSTKPDNDNAVKLLQDVLADLEFFETGDQQIADLRVAKFWGEKATVCIEIEEVASDIYRVKR